MIGGGAGSSGDKRSGLLTSTVVQVVSVLDKSRVPGVLGKRSGLLTSNGGKSRISGTLWSSDSSES